MFDISSLKCFENYAMCMESCYSIHLHLSVHIHNRATREWANEPERAKERVRGRERERVRARVSSPIYLTFCSYLSSVFFFCLLTLPLTLSTIRHSSLAKTKIGRRILLFNGFSFPHDFFPFICDFFFTLYNAIDAIGVEFYPRFTCVYHIIFLFSGGLRFICNILPSTRRFIFHNKSQDMPIRFLVPRITKE